jgi:hypothetical protein
MNDNTSVERRRPPPLPSTKEAWDAARHGAHERTLNDHVQDIYHILVTSPEYAETFARLLDAVYDEDAVEGSLSADNLLAAKMIRDYASEGHKDEYVEHKKLATISKSLGVVMRRYGVARSQRARMVEGEMVPLQNGTE